MFLLLFPLLEIVGASRKWAVHKTWTSAKSGSQFFAEIDGYPEYKRGVVSPRCDVDVLVAVETGCCLQEAKLRQIKNVLKDFATSLHESIDGEDHGLRLSMISFGDHTKSHLSFNDSSERAFKAAVDELDLFGEPVQFNQLFNDLPNHTKNYRQSARKTIVLFTDGNGVDAPNFEILEDHKREVDFDLLGVTFSKMCDGERTLPKNLDRHCPNREFFENIGTFYELTGHEVAMQLREQLCAPVIVTDMKIDTGFPIQFHEIAQEGLPGLDGPPGKDGKDGRPGRQGQPGKDGRDGLPGPMGFPGKQGDRGNPGKHGARGATGEQGPRGKVGERGPPGQAGNSGTDKVGPRGEQGPEGPPGTPGKRGFRGNPGKDGKAGEPGEDGKTGPSGKQGPQGPVGDAGEDGEPGFCPEGISLQRGAPGAPGIPGQKGIDGFDGQDGTDGENGEAGAEGPRGSPGAPGSVGLDGEAGKDGEPGHDGLDGARGKEGPSGGEGEVGPVGRPGPVGLPGDAGAVGDEGSPGQAGLQGEQGHSGEDGQRGVPGKCGLQGSPGIKGPPGRQGSDGEIGAQGAQGCPGPRGPIGNPGNPGVINHEEVQVLVFQAILEIFKECDNPPQTTEDVKNDDIFPAVARGDIVELV